jgi:hypothetical protein
MADTEASAAVAAARSAGQPAVDLKMTAPSPEVENGPCLGEAAWCRRHCEAHYVGATDGAAAAVHAYIAEIVSALEGSSERAEGSEKRAVNAGVPAAKRLAIDPETAA